MTKNFHEKAYNEYLYWHANNPKIFQKITRLLKSIERDGAMSGEGKPERLRYRAAYSRRIDDANRLIYEINGNTIDILSCRGHYE